MPQLASRNILVKRLAPQWHQEELTSTLAQSHSGIGQKTHQSLKCQFDSHGLPGRTVQCCELY